MFRIQDLFRVLSPVCLVGALVFAGCDSLGSLTTVEGQVTVDGQPLKGGTVTFYDASSGTNKGVDITGVVGSDGKYKMTTNGKAGVPKGKYKATVNAASASSSGDAADPTKAVAAPTTGAAPPPPQQQINVKYGSFTTTDLTVEVPSASYDLKLTR
jgi:hypothetical protein